ncbi:hypothetical protein FACS189429_1920 [Bacteroidia bacterium]|nr:hypothetical protein FACS189429_1920 [Bacteroidia bacterium]
MLETAIDTYMKNIAFKTDVGRYLYETEKPHAMSGIANVQSGVNQDVKQFIDYTPFHKISRIRQGADEFNITDQYNIYYGLDQQRIKTEQLHEGNILRTRYYIGTYEEENAGNAITKIDYIFTPTGLTAIQKGLMLYYVHTDRQGSIERITDIRGSIQTAYAYTAWGGRIKLSGTDITDRGYTGHEHLTAFQTADGFTLINMNGRVYDPVLARFLSPDPYVQAPDFTQSFNRYSYCLNNPFKYTDPDGNWWFYFSANISIGKNGIEGIGVSVGIGINKVLSVGISVGYNFTSNSFSATANVNVLCFNAYAGYDTGAGWIAGAGIGFGNVANRNGFSLSTNVLSVGVGWSQKGGFSAHALGFSFSNNGIEFNPSLTLSYTYQYDPNAVKAAAQARAAAQAAAVVYANAVMQAAKEAALAGITNPDLMAAVKEMYPFERETNLSEVVVIGYAKPRWMSIAKGELGVSEWDPGDNPAIVSYHATTGGFKNDETHWCSSFANWTFEQAGIEGTGSAKALSWATWGQTLSKPAYGSLAIIDYGGGKGHVGFVAGVNSKGKIILLGGNQSDMVKYSAFTANSIFRYVYPIKYTPSYNLPLLKVGGNTSFGATR